MRSDSLEVEVQGGVATVRLDRPERRNALDEKLIRDIGAFFSDPPVEVQVAVLLAEGNHFCAGLDLAEHNKRTPFAAMENSQQWHHSFGQVEDGDIPVVAALHGAVIGGGLELALAAHIRIADSTTFYSLPEGRLGIFVGGGGSVRIGRVLGEDRMREMMLTGRQLSAEDGQRHGLSHELVEQGEATTRAFEVARQVAGNAPLNNRLILAALPRIADMGRSDGLWAEALTTALSQSTRDSEEGMQAFLDKRPPRFDGV